jgi:hypothetical protein
MVYIDLENALNRTIYTTTQVERYNNLQPLPFQAFTNFSSSCFNDRMLNFLTNCLFDLNCLVTK